MEAKLALKGLRVNRFGTKQVEGKAPPPRLTNMEAPRAPTKKSIGAVFYRNNFWEVPAVCLKECFSGSFLPFANKHDLMLLLIGKGIYDWKRVNTLTSLK